MMIGRVAVVVLSAMFVVVLCVGRGAAQGDRQASVASMLVEAEGQACMGQDNSRAETQELALAEAKRMAVEQCRTYVSSETAVENGLLKQDLLKAYAKASVRLVEQLSKGWHQVVESGFADQCYRTRIRAEVVPASITHPQKRAEAKPIDNPRGPLAVEVWTDKQAYKPGDRLRFSFRGNKPFYALAVYRDVEGNLVLATPYRRQKQYQGGTVYEIPGQEDRFTLVVTPPFGSETLTLVASTRPFAKPKGRSVGDFFLLEEDSRDLDVRTRGLAVLAGGSHGGRAEFAEAMVRVDVQH